MPFFAYWLCRSVRRDFARDLYVSESENCLKAVIATPALLERAVAPAGTLVARQSGLVGLNLTSIPSACQNDCSEVMKLKDCGVDTSCLCSDTVSDNIAKCLNCFVTNDNKTLPLKDAQTNMDGEC